MATAVGNRVVVDKAAKASSPAYDMSEWYDSRFYKLDLVSTHLCLFPGMDSMEPEFGQIWMGLWRFQMMLWPTMALIQVITRFSNLLDVQWNKQSRVILDNVI